MVLNRNPTAGRTALVALLLILMAASAAHAQAPGIDQATLEEPNQKTREVSTAELKRTLANKTAVVLDARPYREFANGSSTATRASRSSFTATARSAARASG
jgi:hypothetical protein